MLKISHNEDLLFAKSFTALKQGKLAEARDGFMKLRSVKGDANRAAVYNNLVIIEIKLGHVEKAKQLFEEMVATKMSLNSFSLSLQCLVGIEVPGGLDTLISSFYSDVEQARIEAPDAVSDMCSARGHMIVTAGLFTGECQRAEAFYREMLVKGFIGEEGLLGIFSAIGVRDFELALKRLSSSTINGWSKKHKDSLAASIQLIQQLSDHWPPFSISARSCLQLGEMDDITDNQNAEIIELTAYHVILLLALFHNDEQEAYRVIKPLVGFGLWGVSFAEYLFKEPKIPMQYKYLALEKLVDLGCRKPFEHVEVASETGIKDILVMQAEGIDDTLETYGLQLEVRNLLDSGDIQAALKLYSESIMMVGKFSKGHLALGRTLYEEANLPNMVDILVEMEGKLFDFEDGPVKAPVNAPVKAPSKSNVAEDEFFEAFSELMDEMGLDLLRNQAISMTKGTDLMDYLGKTPSEALRSLLQNHGSLYKGSIKKSDMQKSACNILKNPEELYRILVNLKPASIAVLEDMVRDGHSHPWPIDEDLSANEIAGLNELVALGVCFVVKVKKGVFKVLVPASQATIIAGIIGSDTFCQQGPLLWRYKDFVGCAAALYGIIPVKSLPELMRLNDRTLFNEIIPLGFDVFEALSDNWMPTCSIVRREGQRYVMDDALEEVLDVESRDHFAMKAADLAKRTGSLESVYACFSAEDFYNFEGYILEKPQAKRLANLLSGCRDFDGDPIDVEDVLLQLVETVTYTIDEDLEALVEDCIGFYNIRYDSEAHWQKTLKAGYDFVAVVPVWYNLGHTNADASVQLAQARSASSGSDRVGRNDPCPCGTGKKYKKCCGK